jgi:hypothetical protein
MALSYSACKGSSFQWRWLQAAVSGFVDDPLTSASSVLNVLLSVRGMVTSEVSIYSSSWAGVYVINGIYWVGDLQIYGFNLANPMLSLLIVYAVVVDLLKNGSNLEGNTLTLYTPLPTPWMPIDCKRC